jgi:hypothetical protein
LQFNSYLRYPTKIVIYEFYSPEECDETRETGVFGYAFNVGIDDFDVSANFKIGERP